MSAHDKDLRDVFYNVKNPAVFGTKAKLRKELPRPRVSKSKIKEWLNYQDVVTLHKTPVQNFQRNHYVLFGIDRLWEIDLCDMATIQKENDGYRFILSVIDVFSKYAWMVSIKNKTA